MKLNPLKHAQPIEIIAFIFMLAITPTASAGCPPPKTSTLPGHFGIEFYMSPDDTEFDGQVTYSATTTGSGTVQMVVDGFGLYFPSVSDIGKTIEIEVATRIENDAETFCVFEITIVNSAPEIQCPQTIVTTIGASFSTQVTARDLEVDLGIGSLHYSLGLASALFVKITEDGLLNISPDKLEHVCESSIELIVTDDYGLSDTCNLTIGVQNKPPVLFKMPRNSNTSVIWGDTVSFSMRAIDRDHATQQFSYSIIDFAGPGTPTIDDHGKVRWPTQQTTDYLGDFKFFIKVTDRTETCEQLNPSNADTSQVTATVKPDFSLSIEVKDKVFHGEVVDIAITLDEKYESVPIGGLDFLIDWDHQGLSLFGASAGGFIENNEWEYFTFRFERNCGQDCSLYPIRIVAVAETNDGSHHPLGYTNFSAGSSKIVRLHFQVTGNRNYACTFFPVRWKWIDCGDNLLSSTSGSDVFISDMVFDIDSTLIERDRFEYIQTTDLNGVLPGINGIPTSCSASYGFATPHRQIEFYNGGVRLDCPIEIDDRGDINLNGLSNEVADASMFIEYLVNGIPAFGVHVEGSIAASEVNRDGIPLTVADLVYLIRKITGDYIHEDDLAPLSNTIKVTNTSKVISTNKELGAILFVFAGDVTPKLLANNMTMWVGKPDGTTRVLVADIGTERISAGEILEVDGTLLAVDASDYDGKVMHVDDSFEPSPGTLPTEFALYQNYPNPFNPSTTIRIDFPTTSDYSLKIYNISGQTVKTFTGTQSAGTLSLVWEPKDTPSGMYFYKLRVGTFVDTKKLLILK